MTIETIPMFLLGGAGYVGIELLYRGRSHISMFLAGGVCFLLLGKLETNQPRLPGILRPVAGAGVITMVELAAGVLFNRDYSVWDYRGIPGNYLGQICPRFFLLWIPLAWAAGRLYVFSQTRLRKLGFGKAQDAFEN